MSNRIQAGDPESKLCRSSCAGGAHWLAPRPGTPRPQAVLPHRVAQRPSPIMVLGGGSGAAFAAGFNVVSLAQPILSRREQPLYVSAERHRHAASLRLVNLGPLLSTGAREDMTCHEVQGCPFRW